MYNYYKPNKENQVICIHGTTWGVGSLTRCLLKRQLNIEHRPIRILPGELEDMVTVTFRDPQRKAVRVEKNLFERYLGTGELGFTYEDVVYFTTTGGYTDKIEILIPERFGEDRLNFAYFADVNIMVINPLQFLQVDQELIERKFAGRCLRNVFFVIMNYNYVREEDKEDFLAMVKDWLGSTFTDYNGNFDRELYERRVFLTDLYTSEMARTGGKYNLKKGRRADPLEDCLTGVPVFEMELKRFLEQSKG